MPDYLLTDPEGQRFKLTAPEFGRNQNFVKEGASGFNTDLGEQEPAFRDWLKENKVPFDPSAEGPRDYDMRGFYRALTEGDPRAASAIDPNDQRLHYPDYWKTPYHETFSNESQWAGPNAPHWNDKDQLVAPNGQVLFDDRPEAGGAQEAAEVATRRMRQSVRPEGGRKEGELTAALTGQRGVDLTPVHEPGTEPKDYLRELARNPDIMAKGIEQAGNFNFGGVTARRTGFASPRQIRSHLDELADRVRSGAMTAEEYGRARQRMGLSSDVPEYLRPREIGTRQVNPQTIRELRSISAQPPEQQMVARAVREPNRRQLVREGILGGGREERELFERYIAPHQDEKTFVDSYFNGAYSPEIRFKRVDEHSGLGQGLDFDGDLIRDGQRLGYIHRVIYPGAGYAYNAFLALEKSAQAGGFTKGLMANQFDLYRKMNLERVEVFASVSLGGYSWAKYGFLPFEADWRALNSPIRVRFNQLQRTQFVSPDDRDTLAALLSTRDPRAIWAISDMNNPVSHPNLKNPTVGKALLAGLDWHGEFRFDNPAQNVRFNDYVATR